MLQKEDINVSLGMDTRSMLSTFFSHLPGELKQKIVESIKILHVCGFVQSLD